MPLNCEQMFLDALGREPTADELRDIKVNLWMLSRAGLDIEAPESAALVAPWAWIWARLPRPRQAPGSAAVPTDAAGSQAEAHESSHAVPTCNLRAPAPAPATIDHEVLASALAAHMPPLIVEHRIGGRTIASALRDSFTMLWIALGAFAVGVTGAAGWHYGAQHQRSTCALSGARLAEPSHRAERSPRPTAHAADRF